MIDFHALSKKFIWHQFDKNGFHNHTIETEDYQIQYWDNQRDGGESKETIVLLHGFGAQAEYQWYPQIASIAQKYRVIVPNLLYFGDSKPKDKALFALQDQAQMMACLIQLLHIDRFHLAGISYGGLVSMEYYRANKQRVTKLILIDSPVKYFGQADLDRICRVYEVHSTIDFFAPPNYLGLRKQIRASFYQKLFIPTFVTKNLYEKLCLPNITFWSKLMEDLLLKIADYETVDFKTECPVLLIWGAFDDIIPLKIAHQLNAYFPNSQLAVIPKTKHLPNLEKPHLFNRIFNDFLVNNDLSKAPNNKAA